MELIDKQQVLDWLDGYMSAVGGEVNRDRSDLAKVRDYIKSIEPVKLFSTSRKYVEIDPGFWQPQQPEPAWYKQPDDTGNPLRPPFVVTCGDVK